MSLFALATALVNSVLNPFFLILWLLLAAAVLMALGYRTFGRRVVYGLAIYLVVILVLPLEIWALRPLEDRFPRPPLPAHVDGIVVLEGGTDAAIVIPRGAFAWEPAVLRLIAGGDLLRRFPEARLIHSGAFERPEMTAEVEKFVFGDLGLDMNRIIAENRSRNTWDNLVFSKELAQPKAGETWMLVTSAVHIPRAMGIARHLGWTMVPWPSDYLTRKDYALFDYMRAPEDRFRMLSAGLHEWVGLIAYRLMGRTDTLFPGPGA
jgi:uncharacterized SAM-binding protein YcdF (DUF218 family)